MIPTRLVAVLLTTTGLVLALAAAPPAQAHPGHGHAGASSLVVDTQFEEESSPVVRATGAFRSCSSVQDLYGDAVDLGFTLAFYGVKEVTCPDGDVILSYHALLSTRGDGRTFGRWTILVSTVPGVRSGEGPLFGDPSRCVETSGDEGCIRDFFWGKVR